MMKKYITKQSSIKGAGKGLFTNAFFKKGEVIGLAHVDGQPTKEIGSNHNHSEKNPTANNIKNGNKRYLIASKNLNPGEEITTNYRLQPELEQPEDFKKKKGGSMTPQKDGYRTYSPFKNLPYIDVKSDTIDSNNIAYDLKLKANNGLTKFIEKNTGLHTLPGAKVIREIPIKRKGGAVLKMPNKKNSKGYSRSLSATNKLFTQNFLFAKPKSRKNKVFDPNSKYYAEGGSLLTKKVTCKKCGWKWDAEDGGKDITTCHECGGQGLVHAQDGGLNKFVSGGNPCSSEKKIYSDYSQFGCISLSQYNNLKAQTRANLEKQTLYKETQLAEQNALKESRNNPELFSKLYTDWQTKYPGQSSTCPNGNCPVDDLVLEPESIENLPILKPGLIQQQDYELQDADAYNEALENLEAPSYIPDTNINKHFGKKGSYKGPWLPSLSQWTPWYKNNKGRHHPIIKLGMKESTMVDPSTGKTVNKQFKKDRNIQEQSGYNRAYYEGSEDEEGNYIPGEIENAETENRRINFNHGQMGRKDKKAQEQYNLEYDEYEFRKKFPTLLDNLNITYEDYINQYTSKKQYGGISDNYIKANLTENEIEEYRKGGFIVEEIDTYQKGGTVYTVKGSNGYYKKVNGQWQVDWNKSGKYQPLSKGDVKARTAVLDKMAKPVDDGMSKVSSNSSDNTKVNYQKPLVESFNRSNNLESFYKKEREKDLQKQKDATAYHNKTNKISDNFTPKAKENLKNSPVIDNKYFINSQKNPIPMPDGYKPENTKLESIEMLYPEKYVIGPGGGLAGLGMKASKAAFAFKPISYLPSVGKALTYHSVYDATTNHIPNTVKLLSDKSKWNNDKSVELFKNLFKITSTAAGFSKYDKLKYFNRARNVGQFIDKGTDANKDALKGTKMLKNFVTTFKKYGGLQKTSPCKDKEYWDGEKCVPDPTPIMQNPSWNQEPVVNSAAYVNGYRGGNPRMSKYSFLNNDQGNIIGGGGLSFPKSGINLNATGVVPVSSNDRQYFKGAYEANVSKDFKNLNLGLGVNTAITGYPGENGFVRDPIKLQPKLNLRYNFQKGGTWTPNDDFFPKKNKTQKKVTSSRDKWKNVTVESNNGKPSYRKEDYIDQVQSEDPKTKAAGLAMQAEHQKQLKAIQAKKQAEIIKQRELLYQQMVKEDKEQLIKEQNKPLLLQISENNKYTPIGEKPKPFVPFKKPGLMEIPIDYESTPRAIASKDERINMFIDKKKKDYLNQTIKKNGADVILSLQDEYMKKINSDKKFRDSNISYDDYLLEKLSDPTYKYKDELINIYKQKYNENTNFIQKGFDNVADFLSDPLNSLENDIWAGENARIPQSRFIVRDPNSPFYDATNERLQYDSSPLNSMLNYVNPFSSAAEANVDYSKGNYSNMFGNLAEIPFKAVGALAAPEVLASVSALPVIGGTTVGTLLNAGFVGLGAYEAVEGPLANNISEAVTSGLTNDWRKAINEGLLVSSYFLGLGELSETMGLARLNNTGKAKNFLPLTLQQYRDLQALSKTKPLQQVSALQKFTDSKIATDAEIIDINNISKPVQSLVDGTVSQRTIPQMMERPALPKPNNIYQQPNFVSDNPGLNALDYLPRVADERNLAQNATNAATNLENVRSAANLESESQLAADFGAIDGFDFSEFGTLTAEEIAALKKEMDEVYHVNTSGPYDDPVNINLETDMNSFIPTVTGYRPPPSELMLPSTIPSNGAANSVNMNLFPGYNSSGIAASIQSPWEASFNDINESFVAIKNYIVDNNIGNGVGDGQDMLKLMSKAGIDENAIQSLADSFDSRGYNYSVPNLNEVEFGSFIHDVTTGIIPLEISPLLPDAINSVIPYLRGTSANVVTSAGPPRTYLGNINSYKPKTVTHTFENGETLASLADKYNVSERSLLVENRISSTADLRPGQEIIISKMKPIESGSYEFTLAQQNMGSSSQKQGMHKTIDETLKDSSLAKDFKLEMKSDVAKTDAKEMKNFLKDLMKDDAYDAEIYKEVKNGVDQNMNNASAYIGYGDTGTKNIYKLKDLKSIINTEDLDKSIKYTKKAFDLLYANQKTLDLNQLKLLRSLQIKLYDLYGTNYIRKILPLREGITDEKVLSELNGLSMQNKGLQAPVGWKNIINKEGEVIATIQIGHMDQGVVISQTGLKLKYHGYNWKYDKNPLTGLEFQNKDEALAALTERLKIVTGEMIQIDRDTWNEVYRNSPISEAEAHEKAKKMMENLDFNNKVGYGKALYGMVNYAAEQMGFGKLMTEAHFAPTTFPSPVTGKPVTAFRARNLWESKSTTDVDGKNVRRFLNANEIEGDRSGRNFYMNYKKGGDPSKLKMFI